VRGSAGRLRVALQQESVDAVPRRIGKYEVLGELGHGGMAVVYRARHPTLQRDVALKVLHPHLSTDPESKARFRREAVAAARLKHPNIVEVYDFADEADSESFMVSELLEGPTLRAFAEKHPNLPPEVVAVIGMVLCDALTCAHGQGVIHRDVKPDNIMLQTGGTLKLTDFGIAFVADIHTMTVTGQVLGSPAHMAPEQIEGRRDIDARADIFATGTVLYALAVGRLPFEAPQAFALLRKILEADYPDPLRAAPGIGHQLATIIRKCLQREPADRWQSAAELRAALAEFVAEVGWDKPVAQLATYFKDPETFAQKHRTDLLARLPDLGVRARKEGRTHDALGYFNRALALDPTNARVLTLVHSIARRRRVRRGLTAGAIVALAASAAAAAVVLIVPRLRSQHTAQPRPPTVRPDAPVAALTRSLDPPITPVTPVVGPALATRAGPDGGPPAVMLAAVTPPAATQGPGTLARATAVAGRTNGNGAGRQTHAVAQAVPQREVHLNFSPPSVAFRIDDGPTQQFGSSTNAPVLSVGRHSFRLVRNIAGCQDSLVVVDVPEGTGAFPIRASNLCTANPSSRASTFVDAGARTGPN